MQIDERRAEAAPARFTMSGTTIPPGAYGAWLAALVENFGPRDVAKWGEIPAGWSFESWFRRGALAPEPEAPRESA